MVLTKHTSKDKHLLESTRSKIWWNRKRSFFGTDKSQHGGYITHHWTWMNSYWMFWIGGLSWRFSVSSFCEFWKITFCDFTPFFSFLTKATLGYLAHLSQRLEWAIAVRFRPSSVNFLHFHLLLENAWLDFNQTWQESSLGVGDSKLFKIVCVVPMGAQGEGPKGPKPCKFQTSSSPDPEGEESSYVVCRYLVRWRTKVVHGSSQGGPNGPLWALCKK